QTEPAKLDEREVSEAVREEVPLYRAEARWLRALSYLHGLDLFGRLPLLTDEQALSEGAPQQASRKEIFDFLETELHDISTLLPAPGGQQYGRVDRAAVWGLQARLFLNAEVYTGQVRYDECIAACQRIIDADQYHLEENYRHLFTTDNHESGEIIFAIPFDGTRTQTWGGMAYLVHAALGGTMNPLDYGVRGAWSGLRTTSSLVNHFTEQAYNDLRESFYTDGQRLEITRINDFRHGYALPKFTNLSRTGEAGSDETFPDTDFPFLRLAEVYLSYAEATLRGGNGNRERALQLVNDIRFRSGAETPLTEQEMTLDFLLRERTRELHWEAHRRTDLIRFKQYTVNG
ncbi:MAG: RagB/SusD family nutrient uptake outer membrane protein, partial [Bacteroidota bacterium]